ncbi:MAG: RIP metalloprotease RseP [Gammaproteobacteria bacterium]
MSAKQATAVEPMSGVLFIIVAFIVAISVLIAVHEFGHFWVAKKLGVKVLRYSIGFGKPIWQRRFGPDQTEYVIAALPLGGYVKMLDEREGNVAPNEVHRAFNRQPVKARIAIVAAGPAFNFLFAIVAYWAMFGIGIEDIRPLIGQVYADSPASRAGLERDDEILAVAGEPTPINSMASERLILAALDKVSVPLQIRKASGHEQEVILDLSGFDDEAEPGEFFRQMGMRMWFPAVPVVIGEVSKDSPALQAGLQAGDRILQIDETVMKDWRDLVSYVQDRPGQELSLRIERNGQRQTILLRPEAVTVGDKQIGRLGIVHEQIVVPDDIRVHYQYPFFSALGEGVTATLDKTVMSLKLFWKLLSGDISVKNISGPIGIAQSAGASASAGLPWFLGFMAFVSINLGILNLLPIPILDGGHLLYYFIEAIKGSPVSDAVQEIGLRIGMALLLTLMILAFYNDLLRIFN